MLFLFITFVQKLTSLNLRGLEVSTSCLNQIIQSFTFLTIINLSNCRECSNCVLENLAKHCPHVKDLNVEGCDQITDYGIQALVRAAVSSKQPLKIAYFNASSTSITTKSLKMLLNGLSLLLSLSFSSLKGSERSANGHTMFRNMNIVNSLQLQHLDVSNTAIAFNQLKLALEGCPNLVELKLTLPSGENGFTPDNFDTFSENLKNLSKLKSLDISTSDESRSQPLSFKSLESFLQQNGHQLESLKLFGAMELSLHVVCFYCSSLKQLVLCDCQLVQPFLPSLETSPKKHRKVNTGCNISMLSDFCSLEYINLKMVKFKDISLHEKQELLYQLLAFLSNLVHLSLKRVPIEENVLIAILQTSSGVHLKKLVLSCYDNITVKTIHAIKDICLNLKRLELFHCWDITWYDIWKINDCLKQNGRKLEVVIPEQNNLITREVQV